MASQVYFAGDWYECVVATTAGESPSVAPAKWVKIELPAFLADAIVEESASRLLPRAGQSDKRVVQKQFVDTALYRTFLRHRAKGDPRTLPVHRAA